MRCRYGNPARDEIRTLRHHVADTSGGGSAVRRAHLKREDGVALTEFALIAPIFMLIVAGLLSFGRVFFYWIEANHMASETARWAVVDLNPYRSACPTGTPTGATDCQSLQQHAARSATTEFANDVKVCINFLSTTELGQPVQVRIQKPFSFLPILNVGQITIRGSSTMRVENLKGTTGGPLNYVAGPGAGGDVGTCT